MNKNNTPVLFLLMCLFSVFLAISGLKFSGRGLFILFDKGQALGEIVSLKTVDNYPVSRQGFYNIKDIMTIKFKDYLGQDREFTEIVDHLDDSRKVGQKLDVQYSKINPGIALIVTKEQASSFALGIILLTLGVGSSIMFVFGPDIHSRQRSSNSQKGRSRMKK